MRASRCAGWLLLVLGTCLAGLASHGVRAFGPIAGSSARTADAALLRRNVADGLRDLTAAREHVRHAPSSFKRDLASAKLREITMRLHSQPANTAWTRAPAASATVTAAMPMIEKKKTSSGGAAVLERPAPLSTPELAADQTKPEDKFKVMLFNDTSNTREYVARSLVQVVGMSESSAFEIMSMAHRNGMALVGIWHLELAEGYCDQLKTRGLIAEIFPVDSKE